MKTGCFVCHSISVYGVKSPAQIGPDLSTAVEDVQTRFGRTLDDFIDAADRDDAVVLSRQIVLSRRRRRSRSASCARPSPSTSGSKAGEPQKNPGQVIESRQK